MRKYLTVVLLEFMTLFSSKSSTLAPSKAIREILPVGHGYSILIAVTN